MINPHEHESDQLQHQDMPIEAMADEQVIDQVAVDQIESDVTNAAEQQSWIRRHRTALSLSALAVGTGVTIALNPLASLEHDVEKVAPWVIPAAIGTEVAWQAGGAMMLAAAGKKIGNPLTIRKRWDEVRRDPNGASFVDSALFKTGLTVNTIGAVGLSSVLVAGATQLPAETWPGTAGLIAVDLASTVALRAPLVKTMRAHKAHTPESTKPPKVTVRTATIEDMDRLADIDLLLFDKAYGVSKPEKPEVVEMLTKRYNNNPEWMFVAEMNGEVEGFVSAFQTNKPLEEFTSWEDSTADGTLEGKVNPEGKYVYVTNMTIKHEAVELGAEDMLLANLFANAIKKGVEYGYFVSRMPYFKRWAELNDIETENNSDMQRLAEGYYNMRTDDGKRYDKQLKMYEGFGFKLKRLVGGGFDDEASLGFGVVCKAECPPYNDALRKKPLLWVMSHGLRQVAKHPKILSKVL